MRRVKLPRRRQLAIDGVKGERKPRARAPPGEGRQSARAPVADEEVRSMVEPHKASTADSDPACY